MLLPPDRREHGPRRGGGVRASIQREHHGGGHRAEDHCDVRVQEFLLIHVLYQMWFPACDHGGLPRRLALASRARRAAGHHAVRAKVRGALVRGAAAVARTYLNGWINILFPYIQNHPNGYMALYREDTGYVQEGRDCGTYDMDEQGPDCEDFPKGLSEAPVKWKYLGTDIDLTFKAGFIGATQGEKSGVVRPMVGLFIAH